MELFLLILVSLIFLGVHLQSYGMKTNTAVRMIDLVTNILVIFYFIKFILATSLRKNLGIHPLLGMGVGIWAWKSYFNIFPLLKLLANHSNSDVTEGYIEALCEESRGDFELKNHPRPSFPCIYLSNHAMGSLDDVVATAALTTDTLTVLMNPGPGGLNHIPANCRKRVCVLPPDTGNRFQESRNILKEEILERGKSMVVFAEDMKQKMNGNRLAPLRTGIIRIAWELNIPIIPLWIDWPSQFPSLFSDTRKILQFREDPSAILPGKYKNFETFHRECFERLETLGFR
jgi:hypothetical protein